MHDPIERPRALAREHHHVQQEHARESPNGATRRGLRGKLQQVTDRFERLLAAWVADDAEREAWRRHLHGDGPAPDAPRLAEPPQFRGTSEAGATVEVRGRPDGSHDVVVDGAIARHQEFRWRDDPEGAEPVRIGEHLCRERFDAPGAAVAALAGFLTTPGAEPPRAWARALYEDGLIGPDFELTPRGRRRLTRVAPTHGPRFGVLVVDAARARVLVVQATHGDGAPTAAPLVELAHLAAPEQRARDHEQYADSRPGLRREGPHGPLHGVSDRREEHRRADALRLAGDAVAEASSAWRELGVVRIVVVASPRMIGAVRSRLDRDRGGLAGVPRRELIRDLTRLAPPALHDALAMAGLIPARRRLPPVRAPLPGTPVVPTPA